MRVYVVQHGEAVAKAVDVERPLTTKGRADVVRLGAFLARLGVRPERIVHSGKRRARQTAEILARQVAPEVTPQEQQGLLPDDAVEPVARTLRSGAETVFLVGHMPFVGRLVDELIAEECISHVVTFRPGTAVCMERTEEGSWGVCWVVPPELLGRE